MIKKHEFGGSTQLKAGFQAIKTIWMKNIYEGNLGGILHKLMKSENHRKGYFKEKQTVLGTKVY